MTPIKIKESLESSYFFRSLWYQILLFEHFSAVPGEFTTMAGRILREAIREEAKSVGIDAHVVIAGLSNLYTHYITSEEEYDQQVLHKIKKYS